MAKDNTILFVIAGLGALYLLTQSNSAFAYPSTTAKPATPSSGGGVSFGAGGSAGASTGASSTSYVPSSSTPVSTPSSSTLPTSPTQYGLQPTAPGTPVGPVTNTDICDPSSFYYDAEACAASIPLSPTTGGILTPTNPGTPDYSDGSTTSGGDTTDDSSEYDV